MDFEGKYRSRIYYSVEKEIIKNVLFDEKGKILF